MKMGTNFLAIVAFAFSVTSFTAIAQKNRDGMEEEILAPQSPKAAPPPTRGAAGAEQDHRDRSKYLDEKLDGYGPPPETPEMDREKAILEQSLKPVNFDFGMNLYLQYNMITTGGGKRDDYEVEPGVNFQILNRPRKTKDVNKVRFWSGFRSAFFNGTGTYDGVAGRYSFTYFGPILGLGKISLGPQSVGADVMRSESSMRAARPVRRGWFFQLGPSLMYKEVKTYGGKGKGEFNSQKVVFDSPGLWAEYVYSWIHLNAVSVNAIAGAQMGDGKVFYYLGVGAGAWQ